MCRGGHAPPVRGVRRQIGTRWRRDDRRSTGLGRGSDGERVARKGSGSSGRWLREHADDVHVKRAQADGYRSRAVYKLRELDEKDRLLHRGTAVLELGSAPGGWTQYAAERVGPSGRVVASDILAMDGIGEVTFVQGDFTEEAVARRIELALGPNGCDLVLSDMAPNLSGVPSRDQARAMELAELALDMARRVLEPDGALAVKVFQGEGFDDFVRTARAVFASVKVRKPAASRPRSREVYLVARKLI